MNIKKRFNRILQIYFILQSKAFVSIEELESRFEISRRTIYRDLNALEEVGIPFFNLPGKGICLTDPFRMQPQKFNDEELLSLFFAEKVMEGKEGAFINHSFSTAMIKIKSSFHEDQKNALNAIDKKLKYVNDVKLRNYLPKVLVNIFQCIKDKLVIKISYQKSGSEISQSRLIEPIGLYYEKDDWYLLAYCQLRDAYRNFRIDRIKKISQTTINFRHDHPDLDTLRNNHINIDATDITIKAENKYAHFLMSEKNDFGFVNEKIEGDDVFMYFKCRSHPHAFLRWFIRFMDFADIVKPEHLKEDLMQIIVSALSRRN